MRPADSHVAASEDREKEMNSRLLVIVGTLNRSAPYFQSAHGTGLAVYGFDEDSLTIEKLHEFCGIDNPTFLSVDEGGNHIYANSEVFGWKEGLVTAFHLDRGTGELTYINTQPSLGSITAHNTVTRDNGRLVVANYGMGFGGPDRSVVVYGIRKDGGLTAPVASIAHSGIGPNPDRQERSHAHSATQVAEDIVVVADLGTDRLISYRLKPDGGLQQIAATETAPGAGPRHVALHPGGRLLFVMNELDSTIASYRIDGNGALTAIDRQPAVPPEATAENHCADIQISPDGRFLYGSNRGHDSIAVFATDHDGVLSQVGFFPCGGATPRNLALTPSGRHLFCANQDSDRITIFKRDGDTGALTATGHTVDIGTPMCIRIIR
jgi:6-phosphogluconolactonase